MSELPDDDALERANTVSAILDEVEVPAEEPKSCKSIRFTRIKKLEVKGVTAKFMATLVLNIWPPYDLEKIVLDFTIDNKERANMTLTPQPMFAEITHHQIDAVDPKTRECDTIAFDQTPEELPKAPEEEAMSPGLARIQRHLGPGFEPKGGVRRRALDTTGMH